jgi:hypothetical protein
MNLFDDDIKTNVGTHCPTGSNWIVTVCKNLQREIKSFYNVDKLSPGPIE